MKYETPELTAVTLAINAIQDTKTFPHNPKDSDDWTEIGVGAYEDWE